MLNRRQNQADPSYRALVHFGCATAGGLSHLEILNRPVFFHSG
jgi:hypothetical protein